MGSPPADPSAKRIKTLNDYDVVCGRGNGVASLSGNIKYRDLIQDNKPRYVTAERSQKLTIAIELVDYVHHKGGRFLKEDGNGTGNYVEIPNPQAFEKTCQALREGPKSKQKEQRRLEKEKRTALGVKVKIDVPARGGKTLRKPMPSIAAAKMRNSLPSMINTRTPTKSSPSRRDSTGSASSKASSLLSQKRSLPSASSIQRPNKRSSNSPPTTGGQFDDPPPELDSSAESSDGTASAGPPITRPSITAVAAISNKPMRASLPGLRAPQPRQAPLPLRRPMTQRQLPSVNKTVPKISIATDKAPQQQQQAEYQPKPPPAPYNNNQKPSYKQPENHHKDQYQARPNNYPHLTYHKQPPTKPSSQTKGWFCDYIHNNDNDWHDMYRLLVLFEHKYGHCGIPPNSCEASSPAKKKEEWETSGLSDWASVQRHVYRDIRKGIRVPTSVELDRLKSLERLGFVWDYEEWHWERNYRNLLEFQQRDEYARMKREKLGDKADPEHDEDVARSAGLALWVKEQRNLYLEGIQGRIHPMRPDRIKRLEKVDFSCVEKLQKKLDSYSAMVGTSATEATNGSEATTEPVSVQ